MSTPIFDVRDLSVAVYDERSRRDFAVTDGATGRPLGAGWVPVIHDVSFAVRPGEVLALVGESGMGKSLAVLAALGLASPSARVTGGEVRFAGERFDAGRHATDATGRRRRRRAMSELRDPTYTRIMGTQIGIIFQDAIAAWDPVYLIGEQSGEVLEAHTDMTAAEIEERVLDLLGEVKLPKQRKFLSFASELSRGEAQRAMLAAALVKGPSLLVADEPFSGLDPPVAQGISELIRDMQRRRRMAMVMVNHNLAQVASLADRVAVMYGGRIVEDAPVDAIYRTPRHPYTEGLLGSIPWPGVERLRPIGGEIPRLTDMTAAECPFADRCPYVEERCRTAVPPLRELDGGGRVGCVRSDELDLRGVSR